MEQRWEEPTTSFENQAAIWNFSSLEPFKSLSSGIAEGTLFTPFEPSFRV